MNENQTLFLKNDTLNVEVYNLKIKSYPNGLQKFKKNSFDTFVGRNNSFFHNGNSTQDQLDMYLKKRVKDRREKIIDLALCNNWKYFLTLTFDPNNKKYFPNGYNHLDAILNLKKWLNCQHNQNKNMRYIIVSEFHKNSGNLHFHGLFNNVNWSLSKAIDPNTNKEIIKNGSQIFNLDNYKLGFSTISEIKDSRKVSIYLSKYITKDLISLKNKKVFWHSKNLNRPKLYFNYINCDLKDLDEFNSFSYYSSFEKSSSKIEVAERRC